MIAVVKYKNAVFAQEMKSDSLDEIKSMVESVGGKMIGIIDGVAGAGSDEVYRAMYAMHEGIGQTIMRGAAGLGLAAGLAFAGDPAAIDQASKEIPVKAMQFDKKMKDWTRSDAFDPSPSSPMAVPGYADAVKEYQRLKTIDGKLAEQFAHAMNVKWQQLKDFLPPIGDQVNID